MNPFYRASSSDAPQLNTHWASPAAPQLYTLCYILCRFQECLQPSHSYTPSATYCAVCKSVSSRATVIHPLSHTVPFAKASSAAPQLYTLCHILCRLHECLQPRHSYTPSATYCAVCKNVSSRATVIYPLSHTVPFAKAS
jgi:hypothetical protein